MVNIIVKINVYWDSCKNVIIYLHLLNKLLIKCGLIIVSFCRGATKKVAAAMADSILMDVENSVMSTFDFLSAEHVVDDEDDNMR